MRYLQSEMQAAADSEEQQQAMDPPDDEEYEFLNQFWRFVCSRSIICC
jgi:hypothetical protein